MTRTKWWCLVGCLSFVAVAGLFWAVRSFQRGESLGLAVQAPKTRGEGEHEDPEDRYIMVGGVRRRASDVEPLKPLERDPEALERSRRKFDYGHLPPVPPDANSQVESVAEALQTDTHPERYSVLVRPASFDRKAYTADPDAYLNVVEPARVFQAAQPGPGVPALRRVGAGNLTVVQGNSVGLKVNATPRMPVTFTSFDAGAFENRLTTITVEADESGLAEANFDATPGTIDRVHILAGSPASSGQVRFVVNVLRPGAAAAENQVTVSRP